MSDNMQDMLNSVKNMINSGNIPDDIKNMISNIQNTSNESNNTNESSGSDANFDINTILKMKNIIDKMNVKDDPRSNLLRSLKPYLRDSRKDKLDQYVNFMKMANVIDFLNINNKENK